MKKNSFALGLGALLLLVFLALLFCFQVRTTEVAVVTTFGEYQRSCPEPGLYFRLPTPIQKVYRFDRRLRNFDSKFETVTTRDAKNLLVMVYVGWRVSDPKIFLERLNGDSQRAEQALESLVRNAKNAVLGSYQFGALVSPDRTHVRFDDIEADILKAVKGDALTNYGLSVELVGIKQLGLPESITAKVFERMQAERQRLAAKYRGEGQQRDIEIRSEADRRRNELLAQADSDALKLKGDAEAAAAPYYAVFEQNPELAKLLLDLTALRDVIKDRTMLILDEQTAPFNLLRSKQAP